MLQKLHFRRTWFALAIVMVLLVITGSLIQVPKVDLPATDKVVHFSMYFLLMAWLAQVVEARFRLGIAIFCSLLGLFLELAQSATGYRSFEWGDVLANIAGVMLGWVLMYSILGKALSVVDTRLARLVSRDG